MLNDSLFWEVNSPHVSYPSFIFGTIHLYRPSHRPLLNRAEVLMTRVDKVFTEAPLSGPPNSSAYRLPEGQNLKILIGTRKYERAKRIFKKSLDLSLDQFIDILPLLTTQQITMKAMNMEHSSSIDAMIYQAALRNGKAYDGLETMEEQLEIMQKISLDYQCKGLIKLSREISGFRKKITKMIDLYDEEKIITLYKSSKKEMGSLRKMLLYERNEVMAQRILENHNIQPSLFTFGAGHLAGKKGVLAILKRKGMKVKAKIENV